MPDSWSPTPQESCISCGYDMRSLLRTGIRRCPECGKHLPTGLMQYIRPQPRGWYVKVLPLMVLPFALGLAIALVLHAWDPSTIAEKLRRADIRRTAPAVWLVFTPIYCYAYTYFFCAAHRLPRAAVGALVPSGMVFTLNFFLAALLIP